MAKPSGIAARPDGRIEAKPSRPAGFLREEWFLFASIATCAVFFLRGDALWSRLADPLWLALIFLWLFGTVMGATLSVVRHADHLAERLGEPYGTLILTLSVTLIEVMSISSVMMRGHHSPTLTRDTLFAVVMILLNGMVGLCLLIGGWRHREQQYNLQGANTYLGVIIPLAVLSLVLPDFTQTTPGPTLANGQQGFLVLVSVGLFIAFLAIQTGRHREFFTMADAIGITLPHAPARRILPEAILLVLYLLPVVFLAEQLAHPVNFLIQTWRVPAAFGGVTIAVLVATPEALGAVRAAMANQLQRSINIFLGSVLSTIGLTIPAMILVSHLIGRDIVLGVEHTDLVLLLLTLAVSIVTFSSGRTNVMQGAVHLILFGAYLLLIVQG